jgi:hypothetical protein
MGAALLLGKPLLIVVPRGRILPGGLRRAADAVVENWDASDQGAQERLVDAMRQVGLQP